MKSFRDIGALERSRGSGGGADRMARRLGWLSLGLGIPKLMAPHRVARLSGTDRSIMAPLIIPAIGARELGHATALLAAKRPGRWTWTRVAGDAMDLTFLGTALMSVRGLRRMRVAASIATVIGIAAVDLYTANRANRAGQRTVRGGAVHATAGITINKPQSEVYRFWRDLENLPRFMFHLQSVRVTGDRRSRWAAKSPGLGRGVGRAMRTIEWDAEIVEDIPDRLIAWRSLPDSDVVNWGQVRFEPGPRGHGTEVHVDLDYGPPGGALGVAIARLSGEEPRQQVMDDLRRFKQVMETGEVVRSEGSPEGINLRRQVKQRPAQPMRADELARV